MKYLLDTHAFLWTVGASQKLPPRARSVIEDPANDVFISAVVLWEIAIKSRRGKLDIGGRSADEVMGDAVLMGFQFISIESDEASKFDRIRENTHFDPFDRMLIWQAICRNMTLVSGDKEFERFKPDGLKLLWK